MEEDPTPIPSVGLRKHLITNEDGVITGSVCAEDLGHTESGYVCNKVVLLLLVQPCKVDVALHPPRASSLFDLQ